MRRELRLALEAMGALVVIGVGISLALQPELVRPPGGGGPDWRVVALLVGAVAVGVATVVQGVVALAELLGQGKGRGDGEVTVVTGAVGTPHSDPLVESLVTAATRMMEADRPADAIQARLLAGQVAFVAGTNGAASALFEQAQSQAREAGLADIERRCSLTHAALQLSSGNYQTAADLAGRALRGPKLSVQRVEALSLHARALWKNGRVNAALEAYRRVAKGFETLAIAERQRRDVEKHELCQAKSYYLQAMEAWRAVASIATYRQRQMIEQEGLKMEQRRNRLWQIEGDAVAGLERTGKLVGAVDYDIGELARVEKEEEERRELV